MAQAQDRLAALRQLYPDVQLPITVENPGPFVSIDLNALVERGEIKDRWFAPSYEPVSAK